MEVLLILPIRLLLTSQSSPIDLPKVSVVLQATIALAGVVTAAAGQGSAKAGRRSATAAEWSASQSTDAARRSLEALGRTLQPTNVTLGPINQPDRPDNAYLTIYNPSRFAMRNVQAKFLWPGAALPVALAPLPRIDPAPNTAAKGTGRVPLQEVPSAIPPAPDTAGGLLNGQEAQVELYYWDEQLILQWRQVFPLNQHVVETSPDYGTTWTFQPGTPSHPEQITPGAPAPHGGHS